MLSEISQMGKQLHDFTHVLNKTESNKQTSEEKTSQTQITAWWLLEGKGSWGIVKSKGANIR